MEKQTKLNIAAIIIALIIIPIVYAATLGTDDAAPDVNDTSVTIGGGILVTGHWYASGAGGWTGDIWLEDDSTRIDNDGSDADFSCGYVTVTLCECAGGCTEDDVNCDVTATGCDNKNNVDIEFYLNVDGNNETLPSSNVFRIGGTTGTYDDDSTTVTVNNLPGASCTYGGSGHWNVNCADNCNIADDVELDGSGMTISGTGTFTTTADITNIGTLHIEGTSATERCVVQCDGGCFTA